MPKRERPPLVLPPHWPPLRNGEPPILDALLQALWDRSGPEVCQTILAEAHSQGLNWKRLWRMAAHLHPYWWEEEMPKMRQVDPEP